MSALGQSKGKKAKLDTTASTLPVETSEPVAGPSSERLDHVQNVDMEENAADGDSEDEERDDGSDEDDDEDLSGISEGSVSGDEEDDYEDIVQANEDAQTGKKKSKTSSSRTYP